MDREFNEGPLRSRARDLEPLSPDGDNKAYARYISAAPVTPLGHFEVSVSTSPSPLPSIPPEARRVVIYAVGNDLTFTDDGTDPSSSHGMIVPADTTYIYDTDPTEDFLMWCSSATDVRVAYYG